MKFALKDKKEKTAVQPAGIISLRIDPETGLPTSEKAKSTTFDYFYTEHAPLLDTKPAPLNAQRGVKSTPQTSSSE